jgi:hypothetical protein
MCGRTQSVITRRIPGALPLSAIQKFSATMGAMSPCSAARSKMVSSASVPASHLRSTLSTISILEADGVGRAPCSLIQARRRSAQLIQSRDGNLSASASNRSIDCLTNQAAPLEAPFT